VAGEIIAGPHVRNACRRHLDDLKRTDGIRFDAEAATKAFSFFEGVLKLSEGQLLAFMPRLLSFRQEHNLAA